MKKEAKLRTFSWGIKCTSVVFGLLFYWLLSFVLEDLHFVSEPSYKTITAEFVDKQLKEKRKRLNESISQVNRNIRGMEEKQKFLNKSSASAERLMAQLLETQKVKIVKRSDLSIQELNTLSKNQALLSNNAQKYQVLNDKIAELARVRQQHETERSDTSAKIQEQEDKGRDKYDALMEKHRIKVAFGQLLFMLPFALFAGYLISRKRESKYRLMYFAMIGAIAVQVFFVIQQYFPERYFKYIVIVFSLLVVARLLVLMVRNFEKPQDLLLIKQYRKAYEAFMCPICDYTIRMGPLKFLLNRKKMAKNGAFYAPGDTNEEPYTCPSCGTGLFEKCVKCKNVRHSLLPHCKSCGNEKSST